MVQGNTCESLINVVTEQQAKDADRLEPKGTWPSSGVPNSPDADDAPPAERRALTHSGIHAKRGKPVVLPTRESSLFDGKANRKASLRGCGYGRVEQANAAP